MSLFLAEAFPFPDGAAEDLISALGKFSAANNVYVLAVHDGGMVHMSVDDVDMVGRIGEIADILADVMGRHGVSPPVLLRALNQDVSGFDVEVFAVGPGLVEKADLRGIGRGLLQKLERRRMENGKEEKGRDEAVHDRGIRRPVPRHPPDGRGVGEEGHHQALRA